MPSRETKIFFALLLILAALIVYRVATREEPKRVKELTFKPGARGQRPGIMANGTASTSTAEEAGKAELKAEKKTYEGVIRNPFGPLYPPPPPPKILPKKPPVTPPPPPPAPFPVITARGPSQAQIESGRIKFLGFLQKEGDRKIFLSRDREVFIVKKGDNVGIFQVGDISDNSVSLIARDTKEELKLGIEDAKATKPVPGIRR